MYGLQFMYVYTVSLCLQGVEGTVSTGQAEAEVETGHMEALLGAILGEPWAGRELGTHRTTSTWSNAH